MLGRLKKSLVESYVGAIAVGWVIAQAITHFAFIFAAPLADWAMRREYRQVMPGTSQAFYLQAAIPELARSVVLLLIGYGMLRWLYFEDTATTPAVRGSETGVSP